MWYHISNNSAEETKMHMHITPGSGARISGKLYGIFLEDINYGCDGGLYAELVPNRAFEFEGPQGEDHRLMRWTSLGGAGLSIRTENPRGEKNPHYLHMEPGAGRWGVRSEGYLGEGFFAARGESYRLTLIARGVGMLTASLVSADGRTLAETPLALTETFAKQEAILTPETAGERAFLTLTAAGGQAVDIDFASLFPVHTFKGRKNGCRADLAQALADLQPSFLRFPGGCIVEGRSYANMYRFRETLGPVEERRTNWNRWQLEEYQRDGLHSPDYFQSYGMGFYEFFQFCEDIGAKPLPILNCGLTCQWHEGLTVPLDEMDGIIQDYFDLIEFCHGAEDTPMGRIRTEMGHPEPFCLEMIGVGNEQWDPVYFERYELIHRAVKAKHPEIELVGCAGWTDKGREFDAAMQWMRETPMKPDYSDEHYYKRVDWFYENRDRYADYDLAHLPAVFAGEYAAHEGDQRNTLRSALAEAAFLTGVENASPNVAMACYAPLFGRIGGYQWKPDLIWFDQERCYPTVNYYVQQLFSCHRGDALMHVALEGADDAHPLHVTAAKRDADGALIVKVVNPHAQGQELHITLPQDAQAVTAHVLSGKDLLADNLPGSPAPVLPVTTAARVEGPSFTWHAPGQSVNVLIIR